jgi:hypothetical protein
VRYPAGDITPHGWYHLTQGNQPSIWLDAYDGSIRFDLMGGLSIPDRFTAPECVQIKKDGLKGLIPPWKHIDQKGATQDGVTNLDTLYDPAEPQLDVVCRGRDGRHTQQVVRHLIGALDGKQQSTLNFLTQDEGHWWGTPRWFQGAPPNPLMGAQTKRQDLSLRLRVDGGFWQSYDDTDEFSFAFESMADEFAFTSTGDLGANWPLYFYEGSGAGHPAANGSQATWVPSGTTPRSVVAGPYKSFTTGTDEQVVTIELGELPGYTYTSGAFNDIWGRMSVNLDGTWKGDGIRARIGVQSGSSQGWAELSRYNSFAKTVMWAGFISLQPARGEKYSLICGTPDDPRTYRIMRNNLPVLTHKEVGTGSLLGSSYRGVGFGMAAGAGTSDQSSPAWLQRVTAGDNAALTQSGFLQATNIGDQPMFKDYIFFGPGTIQIWDGPGAGVNDYIEFGPLLANQSALLRTDPRDRNVYDLSSVPATPNTQEDSIFSAALKSLVSFASVGNTNPLLQVIQSIFGIFGAAPGPVPPQGNLYSLLSGRFSDASAIPAQSPGNGPGAYSVKVQITGGTADTKVISSGTPLRRYPL